jgi:hypothetical protein
MDVILPFDELIFFKMVKTTNQYSLVNIPNQVRKWCDGEVSLEL